MLPDSYLLFVGSRSGYKDFDVLLAAFVRLAARYPDLHVVAVGGGALRANEVDMIAKRGLSDRVHQLTLSDDELAATYCHAACFVFPSRYEGFGLPTLEAMASGCPVVLARSSSHVEVGSNAAAYFTPGNDAQLGDTVEMMLDDPDHRAASVAAGIARAAEFPWSRTGAATLQAYRDTVGATE